MRPSAAALRARRSAAAAGQLARVLASSVRGAGLGAAPRRRPSSACSAALRARSPAWSHRAAPCTRTISSTEPCRRAQDRRLAAHRRQAGEQRGHRRALRGQPLLGQRGDGRWAAGAGRRRRRSSPRRPRWPRRRPGARRAAGRLVAALRGFAFERATASRPAVLRRAPAPAPHRPSRRLARPARCRGASRAAAARRGRRAAASAFPMIGVVGEDAGRAEQLLGQHRPRQQVRPGRRPERQQQVGLAAHLFVVAVGGADQEARLALAAVAPAFELSWPAPSTTAPRRARRAPR